MGVHLFEIPDGVFRTEALNLKGPFMGQDSLGGPQGLEGAHIRDLVGCIIAEAQEVSGGGRIADERSIVGGLSHL